MAFEIDICASDTGCDGITFVDQTGSFSLTNPEGYGAPPDPGPIPPDVDSYTSYSLEVWFAVEGGVNLDTVPPPDPDFTLDLLTATHTTDPDTGYVTWPISLEDLGIETIRSGWWFFRVTAVYTNSTPETFNYTSDAQMLFLSDLTTQTDAMMSKYNLNDCCDDCSVKRAALYQKFFILKNFTGCCADEEGATLQTDYLYFNLQLCSDC